MAQPPRREVRPRSSDQTYAYVIAEAMQNIAFVKSGKGNVEQAHQINTSLANIVAIFLIRIVGKNLDA